MHTQYYPLRIRLVVYYIGCVLAVGRESQCSNDSLSFPSASIFNDMHNCLAYWSQREQDAKSGCPTVSVSAHQALQSLNLDAAVIFGHSLGGEIAVDMITGESFLPSLRTEHPSLDLYLQPIWSFCRLGLELFTHCISMNPKDWFRTQGK